jgi:hypothetical protein
MSKAHAWCGTLNNPRMPGEDLKETLMAESKATYCVFQLEKGESGTPHYQLYIRFKNAVGLDTCKKRLILHGWHLEQAKGNAEQNKKYCTKEPRVAGPWEFGEMPQQGKRSDIQAAIEDLKTSPESLESLEFIDKHIGVWMKYDKMLTKYRDKVRTIQRKQPTVIVIIGDPGIGKSTWCRENFPTAFWMSLEDGWWDGYQSQKIVILDDFDETMFHGIGSRNMKLLWDRNPFMVKVKGSAMQMIAETFIVTSNYPISKWSAELDPSNRKKYNSALAMALERRITVVKDLTGALPEEISTVFGQLSQKYGVVQIDSETVAEPPQKKQKAREDDSIELGAQPIEVFDSDEESA